VSAAAPGEPRRESAAPGENPRESAATRSRAATRTRLLEAGRSLFASRGLHRVTSHDIARHAGVAAGTFYLHFRDKRDLFGELARDSVAALRERLDAAGGRGLEGRQGVRVRTEALVLFVEENRDLARILFSADADAAAVESDVLGSLADAIAEGRRRRTNAAQGTPPLDPVVLSQALVGMLARVVAWWAQDPSRASRETVIDTLTRIQLSGTHPA
jgi:AcrR family transcriptional regulator